jgi:hypothetical protein
VIGFKVTSFSGAGVRLRNDSWRLLGGDPTRQSPYFTINGCVRALTYRLECIGSP